MKQDKNQVNPTFFDDNTLSGQAFQERNQLIVDSCDILLAVWNGKSRGTQNTLAYARRINKPAFLIKFRR